MATRRQRIEARAEEFVGEFLRQLVPPEQRKEYRFVYGELDVAFQRYFHKARSTHDNGCLECNLGVECLLPDALQTLYPNGSGISQEFHRYILGVGRSDFDLFSDSGRLFLPAFSPAVSKRAL